MQINADRVRAIFVFANIDKLEFFTFTRLLFLRVVRIGNECLAPLIFRERLEEIDDFVELVGYIENELTDTGFVEFDCSRL